jgi:diguanylate cyclase (GGDEF)-like protein
VFQFISERLREIIKANAVLVFLRKENCEQYNVFFSGTDDIKIKAIFQSKDFDNFLKTTSRRIIDQKHYNECPGFLKDILLFKNLIIEPVYLREQIIGFVVSGNVLNDFVFSRDDYEVIEFFCRNLAIVWEHERLSKRVEDLENEDPLTGIYNERFFMSRLKEEIQRAGIYQRPCGLLTVRIVERGSREKKIEIIALEKILKRAVGIFKTKLRPIDIMARTKENELMIILIEKSKRQCWELVRELKELIRREFNDHSPIAGQFIFGVAESPVDGVIAADLLTTGEQSLNNNEDEKTH